VNAESGRTKKKGELAEREVMLELARLDENLRQKAMQLGVENLEAEMNTMIPHLMSSAATLETATALKEKQLDKASDELKKGPDPGSQHSSGYLQPRGGNADARRAGFAHH